MKARTLIIILSLECVLQTCSHAFVLRKRSAWDENDLSKALQVVERERLRLGQSQERPGDWERPDDRERAALVGSLLNRENEFSDSEEYDTPGYSQELPSDSYTDDDAEVYDRIRSQKRTKSTGHADLKELQGILDRKREKSPNELTDDDTYDTDYKKRLYDPSSDDLNDYEKKSILDTKDTGRDLSSAEISKLLNAVENVEKNVISGKISANRNAEKGQTEVSKDELADVLKDDEEEENKDEGDAEPEVIEEKPKSVITTKPNGITVTRTEEKEWPSLPAKAVSVTEESVMYQPVKSEENKRSKQKRSGIRAPVQGSDDGPPREETAAELGRKYLKVFLQLENDENNNLANALNLATLSQIKKTDKYIPEEIRYLRKAILDEEMIQKLDDLANSQLGQPPPVVEEGSFVGESPKSEEDEFAAEVPLIRKRQDPGDVPPIGLMPKLPYNADRKELQNLFREYLKESGKDTDKWFDGPVSQVSEGASNEENDDNLMNPFLRELMKAYEDRKSEKPWEKRADAAVPVFSEDAAGETELDGKKATSDKSASEEDITNALAAYVDELSPSERRELTAAVEDKLAAETCPAVRKLSDNCLFMDMLKMTVDDEARNLCNRHQMCYSCGAVSGRSRGDCDTGYLEEAKSLCEKEQNVEKCKEEATGLFLLMSEMHTFVPTAKTDDTCASPCAMSYVLGSSSD